MVRGLFPTAVAASFIVAGSAGQSSAKQLTQMQIGNWSGGAYSNDANGVFSHCAVGTSYNSGIAMFISVDRSYGWSLGFAKDQWTLRESDKYPILYKIDNSGWKSAEAIVVTPKFVRVPMVPNSELVTLFRRGRQMDVSAAGQTFIFNLNGTSAAVASLSNCVAGQLTLETNARPPENPFLPGTKSPQPSSGASEEATRVATNFLLAAGMPDARMMARDEVPAGLKNRGAVWSWRDGLGALDVASGTAEQTIAGIIANDAAGCSSKFASGSNPPAQDGAASIYQAFTVCDGSPAILNRYYVVNRPGGGLYLFSIAQRSPANGQTSLGGVDLPVLQKAIFGSAR